MAGRPRKASGKLAPLEAEVMGIVWASAGSVSARRAGAVSARRSEPVSARRSEPVSARQVLEALNSQRVEPLAYTTVMTVMNRLAAKNVLERHGQRRRYVYEATATDAAGLAVREVLRVHGEAAVAHFVGEARANPSVLRRLMALLEQDS